MPPAALIWVDPQHPDPAALAPVAEWLRQDAVVGVPTDTLYGLAANAFSAAAIARVFEVKQRDAANPILLVVRDLAQARECAATIPPQFEPLAAAFWPGPLTLVLPVAAGLPAGLSAGTGAIALRQPASLVLAALLELTGFPLTATSANRSGEPAAGSAQQVAASLGDRLAAIVDSGPAPSTLPSTLLDLRTQPPRILREGAVPKAALARFL